MGDEKDGLSPVPNDCDDPSYPEVYNNLAGGDSVPEILQLLFDSARPLSSEFVGFLKSELEDMTFVNKAEEDSEKSNSTARDLLSKALDYLTSDVSMKEEAFELQKAPLEKLIEECPLELN